MGGRRRHRWKVGLRKRSEERRPVRVLPLIVIPSTAAGYSEDYQQGALEN